MEELTALFRVCAHIKTDGVRCGSPALLGGNFCFQHIGGKVPSTRAKATTSANAKLKLAYPGDRQAIQHNLFLVAQALNDGKIDTATANTFNRLYRTCEQNLRHWEKVHDNAPMLPPHDEISEAPEQQPFDLSSRLESASKDAEEPPVPSEPGSPRTVPCPWGVETTTAADSEIDDEEDAARRFREWQQSPQGQTFERMWGKPPLRSHDPDTAQPAPIACSELAEGSRFETSETDAS